MNRHNVTRTGDGREIAEATRSALVDVAMRAYEEAGLSGLCADGRWEVALGAIRSFDVGPVIGNMESADR